MTNTHTHTHPHRETSKYTVRFQQKTLEFVPHQHEWCLLVSLLSRAVFSAVVSFAFGIVYCLLCYY